MQISEVTFTVSDSGSLKIPAKIMREMGLCPGNHIRVAYLTEDGKQNAYQEFVLSVDSLTNLSDELRFQLPCHLLTQANIPAGADLQILCMDGCLLICRDSALHLDELSEVLEGLQIASELILGIPADIDAAKNMLHELTDSYEKGAPADDDEL